MKLVKKRGMRKEDLHDILVCTDSSAENPLSSNSRWRSVQNNLKGNSITEIKKEKKQKPEVSETYQITFDMYQQGKRPEQIAAERGYSLSTILSHLAFYVKQGQLPLSDFVTQA